MGRHTVWEEKKKKEARKGKKVKKKKKKKKARPNRVQVCDCDPAENRGGGVGGCGIGKRGEVYVDPRYQLRRLSRTGGKKEKRSSRGIASGANRESIDAAC